MSGQHYSNTDLINKYLYNGKEQQDQTNYYDYGFRQFDAQLGRWHVVDAMSEKYFSTSPYAYVQNDPINHRDYLGLWVIPIYFDGVYRGKVEGTGNSWGGASYNGIIPGGANGEYGRILRGTMRGHMSSSSHTQIRLKTNGWGLRSAGEHSLKRLWNWISNLHLETYTTHEDVWVWDDETNFEYPQVPPIEFKLIENAEKEGKYSNIDNRPDWNKATERQKASVIFYAWSKSVKNRQYTLNVPNLFKNYPKAVPNGMITAKINLGFLNYENSENDYLVLSLHIGSGKYKNIIDIGGIPQDRNILDINDSPVKTIWDFNNIDNGNMVSISFPYKYNSLMRTFFGYD